MASTEKTNLFYDIASVKEIPILSVADTLGLFVQKRGKNYWCKVRNERNASVILHPDRNTFYDFGNQTHGDVIRFVQYAKDISCGEAIRYLGKTFGLTPNLSRQEIMDRPLTNGEYARIGLHGDMATKNFVFPIGSVSVQELAETASYFRMSLNELQKQEPEVYKDLIKQNAIPYVEDLRSRYYLDVWNYFHLAYSLGDNSLRLFRSEKIRERFLPDTRALNSAERILYRACRNAGLEPSEPLQHDPVNVVRQLLQGRLSISLGTSNLKNLSEQALSQNCAVCEDTVPFYSYFDDRLQSFCHWAVYRSGKVTIRYLSSDRAAILPVLKEMKQLSNRPLEQQILASAERREALTPIKKKASRDIFEKT